MSSKKPLKEMLFIFPVMGYYAIEALIVGLVISILWKIFLSNFLGSIAYPQIVVLYWIIKMLFFNVFNLITGLGTLPDPDEEKPEE